MSEVEDTAVLVETLELLDNDVDDVVPFEVTLLDDNEVLLTELDGLNERPAATPTITTIKTITTTTRTLLTPALPMLCGFMLSPVSDCHS
jgi:hypothetical protein